MIIEDKRKLIAFIIKRKEYKPKRKPRKEIL